MPMALKEKPSTSAAVIFPRMGEPKRSTVAPTASPRSTRTMILSASAARSSSRSSPARPAAERRIPPHNTKSMRNPPLAFMPRPIVPAAGRDAQRQWPAVRRGSSACPGFSTPLVIEGPIMTPG